MSPMPVTVHAYTYMCVCMWVHTPTPHANLTWYVCQQQLTRDSDDEQKHPLQEGHRQKTVAQALYGGQQMTALHTHL